MRLFERTQGAVGFFDRLIVIYFGAVTQRLSLAHFGVSVHRVFVGVTVLRG